MENIKKYKERNIKKWTNLGKKDKIKKSLDNFGDIALSKKIFL